MKITRCPNWGKSRLNTNLLRPPLLPPIYYFEYFVTIDIAFQYWRLSKHFPLSFSIFCCSNKTQKEQYVVNQDLFSSKF
jgi:hypothetical protein